MNRELLLADIKREEGCRLSSYQDTKGIWTIGYGATGPDIGPGLVWGQDMADQMLNSHIDAVVAQMDKMLPWWRMIDDIRANVLVEMAYQMGVGGLMAFKQMLAHVKAGEWDLAAAAGLDSQWARSDSPARAKREMAQLETGVQQS